MRSPKRIVLLGNVSSMMIKFREEMIKDLINQGYELYCIAQHYTDNEKEIISDWGAIAVESPLNSKGMNPLSDFFAAIRLTRLFNAISPDIVFSFFVKPVIFGTIASRLARVPRIVGMIEGLGNAFTAYEEGFSTKALLVQKIQIFLYKRSLPYLDRLIFLNHDDKKDLVDKYRIKVKSLHVLGGIGVDLRKFPYKPASTDSISFIFVARLLKEKGIFEYLKAAEKVKSDYPNVIFYLLGAFDKDNPFALKASDLKEFLDKETVVYLGYVDTVAEYLARSSVFVLPSYREGVPRSTQEAMAIGRAVITTNVAGCRETVKNDINGFIIPPFSSDALAEKMIFFVKYPKKINKMGLESRKIAEDKYDVNEINNRLIHLILGN